VLGTGTQLGELSHKPRREVLIEEQLHAAGTDSRRHAVRSRRETGANVIGREVREVRQYLSLGHARGEVLEHVV